MKQRTHHTPAKTATIVVTALGIFLASAISSIHARDLTFGERVKAQEAIERVYWNHRIWPKENPGPKPPLSAVMPDSAIRAKVEDTLRMSALLDSFWHQPLTGEQLQAEIDRMVRATKAPQTLRELFAALDNDPLLIAECLARPALARRRLQAAFASDQQIYGARRTYTEWAREQWGSSTLDAGAIVPPPQGYSVAALPLDDCAHDTWTAIESNVPEPRSQHVAVWTGSEMIVWGGHGNSLPFGALDTGGRYNPATDSWFPTSTGENVPAENASPVAVWTGTEMIVWGGYSRGLDVNTGGRYNPTTDSWAASSLTTGSGANVPAPRERHTAVWTGSEMIIWGGWNFNVAFNNGGRYDPLTDTWAASSLTTGSGANVPSPRGRHTAVWTGSEMIVWGGAGSGQYVNTGGRFNPSTDTWATSSLTTGSGANVPSARGGHTAVWTGTEMIVWGGDGGGGDANTGGRFEPSIDAWVASSLATGSGSNVPSARGVHIAVWTGSEMIVWGGYDAVDHFLNTGGRFNPSTDSWAASSLTTGSGANVPASRLSFSVVWTGSEMIVWGGSTDVGLTDSGGRYDPATDTWTATFTPGAPVGRAGHVAVWTGAEMIVWGGFSRSGGPTNTGGRFDPATVTWTATSTMGAPSGRSGHSAVWTGTEMVVWGGSGGSLPETGGRYDPAADGWRPTSTTGAPPGRWGHTAVWTGSAMLVWGGRTGDEFFATGGSYDPTADTWTATSTLAAPTARIDHTAVWTGSRMVIWGGSGQAYPGYYSTGGRYDPITDTWTATSTAGAPVGRSFHTVVWTGGHMFVWGGRRDDQFTGTGGGYDPVADRWTSTSLVGAPSARDGHTAVWTGSVMVVWGGRGNGNNVLGTGGRYAPSTDLWTATSTATAPSARDGHTAVWTGSEMIVWGGAASAGYMNDGARYAFVAGPDSDGDGYTACDGDCNDDNPNVHPRAAELCNGIDDDCDGVVDNGGSAMCNDGNPCTRTDVCVGGVCVYTDPVVCGAPDDCHGSGVCDPTSGSCLYPNKPDGTTCHDADLCTGGETCQAGACVPGFSGLNEPNPRTTGYYRRLCLRPHSGDQLTDADAVCVGQITATFAGIATVAEICNVIEPVQGGNDWCGKAEDDLIALSLNICRGRVCPAQSIDSQCGGNGDVAQSFAESDGLLANPSRDRDACSLAKCLDEEINNGRAIEMNTLSVHLEGSDVRLDWSPPYLDDGTGLPRSYKIWRRPLGSLAAFAKIGQVSDPTFVDTASGAGSFEYEITAVMN